MRLKGALLLCLSFIVSACASARVDKQLEVILDLDQEKPELNRYVEIEINVSSWPPDKDRPMVMYQTWLEPGELSTDPHKESQFFCTNENQEIAINLYTAWFESTANRYEMMFLWIQNLNEADFDKTTGHMSPYHEVESSFVLKSPGFVILKEEFITRSGKNYHIMITKQSKAPPDDQRPTLQNPQRHPSYPDILIKGLSCHAEPHIG